MLIGLSLSITSPQPSSGPTTALQNDGGTNFLTSDDGANIALWVAVWIGWNMVA